MVWGREGGIKTVFCHLLHFAIYHASGLIFALESMNSIPDVELFFFWYFCNFCILLPLLNFVMQNFYIL